MLHKWALTDGKETVTNWETNYDFDKIMIIIT